MILFEEEKTTCMLWSSPRKLLSVSVGSTPNSAIIACVYWEWSNGDGRSGLDWTIPSAFWTLCGLVCECCGSVDAQKEAVPQEMACHRDDTHISLFLSFSSHWESQSVSSDCPDLEACMIGTISYPTVPVRQCSFPVEIGLRSCLIPCIRTVLCWRLSLYLDHC